MKAIIICPSVLQMCTCPVIGKVWKSIRPTILISSNLSIDEVWWISYHYTTFGINNCDKGLGITALLLMFYLWKCFLTVVIDTGESRCWFNSEVTFAAIIPFLDITIRCNTLRPLSLSFSFILYFALLSLSCRVVRMQSWL